MLSNLPELWGKYIYDKYLQEYFNGAFISGSLGIKKPDPRIYAIVQSTIKGPITYFDDKKENIETARTFNWNAILITSKEQLLELLEQINKNNYI